MKKLLPILICLLFPLTVNAMAYSESFDVGDEIIVVLTSSGESAAFNVLKSSASGEQTVTAIYQGVTANSPTVYDETIPGSHDATTAFESTAYIYSEFVTATETWTTPTLKRLLTTSDLDNLGIATNTSGVYEIYSNYSFLAPIKLSTITDPDGYNYWTQSADTSATNASVYCVTYNESRSSTTDVYATLVSEDITSTTNGPECAIRPVIVIDKQYIQCNNSKSPQTGENNYYVQFGLVILLAGLLFVIMMNKNVFKKI